MEIRAEKSNGAPDAYFGNPNITLDENLKMN
jgi:hypothetical protein